jgi:hypothetical protein
LIRKVRAEDFRAYLDSPDVKAAQAANKTATQSLGAFLKQREQKANPHYPDSPLLRCQADLTALKDRLAFGNFTGIDFSGDAPFRICDRLTRFVVNLEPDVAKGRSKSFPFDIGHNHVI